MLRTAFSPPRCIYEKDNTVSVITAPNYQVYYRTNFEFTVKDRVTITGSIWRDHEESNPNSCVIFLHSLGTNQFEVLNIIPILCCKQLCIVSFDFPGCGMSGGEILPLDGSGAEIVKNCVEKLKNDYHISKFALWGRSMGAAVALQSVSMYNEDFQCVVSDSAFSCTEKILFDQGKANGFPSFMISMIMPMIKKEAQAAFNTNVDNPFPIGYVSDARAPLLMGHGKQDVFVPLHHAELLFQKYGMNNKQLYFFGGKHNSPRPGQWYQTAARFINRHMGIDSPPRIYDLVFRASQLHIGPVDMVLPEVLRVNAINMQHEQEYRNQLEQNDLRAREKNLQQLNRQLPVNAGNANTQSQNSYSSFESVDSLQAYQEKMTRDEMSQPIVNNTDQAQAIKGSHKKHGKKDKKKSKKDADKKHKKGHKDQKHRHESKTDEVTTSTNSVDPSYTTENSKEITSTTNETSATTNVLLSTTNETSTLTYAKTTKNNDSSAKTNDPSTSSAIINPNVDTKEKTNNEKGANESTENAHQHSRSGTPKKDKRAHLVGACSAPITDLNISSHLKAKSEALLTDDETSSYSSLEDDKKENTKEIPTMKHKSSHHPRSHSIAKSHSMNLCTLDDQNTKGHRSTASDNDNSTDEINSRRRKHHRSSSSHSARLAMSQEGERSHHSRHDERTSAIHSARESESSHEKRRRRHSSITSPDQGSASDDSCLSENGSNHHGHHHHSRRRKSNADESITSTLEENSKLISNLNSDNTETENTMITGKESKNNTGLISDSD